MMFLQTMNSRWYYVLFIREPHCRLNMKSMEAKQQTAVTTALWHKIWLKYCLPTSFVVKMKCEESFFLFEQNEKKIKKWTNKQICCLIRKQPILVYIVYVCCACWKWRQKHSGLIWTIALSQFNQRIQDFCISVTKQTHIHTNTDSFSSIAHYVSVQATKKLNSFAYKYHATNVHTERRWGKEHAFTYLLWIKQSVWECNFRCEWNDM